MTNSTKKAALLAAAMLFMAAPATGQSTDDANTGDAYATPTVEREDDEFPWGLLGLLGLAGLLGLRRKEQDIHVDARRDTTRP